MRTRKGETSKKPNGGKGGNMGQHQVKEGRKSCRWKCNYEKSFTGKERVRDLNSMKTEGEEMIKTRGIAASSNVIDVASSNAIDVKCCNQPSLTLITVSFYVVAEN